MIRGIDTRSRGPEMEAVVAFGRPATGVLRVRSAPQTRHFVAAAPTRVPHVGQSRGAVAEEADDLFMGDQHYTSRHPRNAEGHNIGGQPSANSQGTVEAKPRRDDAHGFDNRGDMVGEVDAQLLSTLLDVGAVHAGGKGAVFPFAL